MRKEDIKQTVYGIILTLCEARTMKDLPPMTHLREFMNSLDVVEVFMQLERIYKISIDDNDIVRCKTIEDIVDIVSSNLS